MLASAHSKPRQRDKDITSYLLKHPTASLGEISAHTGIPNSTVQKHMRRLTGDVFRQELRPNFSRAGYPLHYLLFIDVERQLGEKELAACIMGEISEESKFKENIAINDIFMSLGGTSPDGIIVDLRATDFEAIHCFVVEGLTGKRGVRKVVATHLAWSLKEEIEDLTCETCLSLTSISYCGSEIHFCGNPATKEGPQPIGFIQKDAPACPEHPRARAIRTA